MSLHMTCHFRIVLCGVKVPLPVMGYRHHPLEYFLSFDGFIYTDPQVCCTAIHHHWLVPTMLASRC